MYDQLTVLAPASATLIGGFCVGIVVQRFLTLRLLRRQASLATGVADSKRHMEGKRAMTANEVEFFNRMERAAPGNTRILAQVSMAAILQTTLTAEDQRYFATRRQFASKIVDYVVCDVRTFTPLLVVELDDAMHDVEKDAMRDRIVKAAGIPTLRFQSTAKPTITELRHILSNAMPPPKGKQAALPPVEA